MTGYEPATRLIWMPTEGRAGTRFHASVNERSAVDRVVPARASLPELGSTQRVFTVGVPILNRELEPAGGSTGPVVAVVVVGMLGTDVSWGREVTMAPEVVVPDEIAPGCPHAAKKPATEILRAITLRRE